MLPKHLSWLQWYGAIQLFLLMAILAQPTLAHTEHIQVQLFEAPIGPYRATVWTYPGVMRAGVVHFTVALLDTATKQPLDNANVLIEVTPLDGQGGKISHRAVQGIDIANPLLYEAELLLKEPGNYQVKIILQDLSGQTYSQHFQIEVVPTTAIKVVTTILLVQTIVFALWFLKESFQTWGVNKHIRNQVAQAKMWTRTK